MIATLAEFNVKAERRPGRVGVWVTRPDQPPNPDGTPREDKIAAIGVKLRRWVSFHGISINVDPDLSSRLVHLFAELNRTLGMTIILATHELPLLDKFNYPRMLLQKGELTIHD